ncbi:hypothetical protein [Streptomyces yaizuensis]|uniref:Uncharacterized protein n=1 Tax=Streptomyces yaizuensis TaxID=2989713 RepID=A0ABQ5P8W8_9ACTN|nr:hypothetical protein [Streptomyces sp. YSPA8]GLF98930.1 hypothetical protein SYYSPA8_31555 [Streptomyces sp. YSPA8]
MIGMIAVVAVSTRPPAADRAAEPQPLPGLSLLMIATAVAALTAATGLLSRRAGTPARHGARCGDSPSPRTGADTPRRPS